MPTRDDYERLLLHGIKPGERVRIPMENDQEYNDQRMVVQRLLESLREKGYHFPFLVLKKRRFNDRIYLIVEHLYEDDPVFEFEKPDGTIETKTISRDMLTSDESEFGKWMQQVRILDEEETGGDKDG